MRLMARSLLCGLFPAGALIAGPTRAAGARWEVTALRPGRASERTAAPDSGGLYLQLLRPDCQQWHPTLPASVQLIAPGHGRTLLTDQSGAVWIAAVRAGEHQLRVRAVGYADTTVTVVLAPGRVDTARISLGIPRLCFARVTLE
jgi:Carboxypeptidase regulatory-like domain